jgi:hypothetical protein
MKQIEKAVKKPAAEYGLTCSSTADKQTKSQQSGSSTWTRYADSRLKQFCSR